MKITEKRSPSRADVTGSGAHLSAVAVGGTNGVDQVTERIQGAAELTRGRKDRATVYLDRRAVSIRGRRDQDIAAEHFRGRSARRMQRLLAEVLNLWTAAGAAERGRAPFKIIGGASKNLRVVADRAKLDALNAIAKAGVEVAGVAELGQVRRLCIVLIAEITGNLADFLPGIRLKHDQCVVLTIWNDTPAVKPGTGYDDPRPTPPAKWRNPGVISRYEQPITVEVAVAVRHAMTSCCNDVEADDRCRA